MVEKIDMVALRENIRRQYAEWPTRGDAVLEFEARAAEVIADLSVLIVKEAVERQTAPEIMLQGIAAILSVPLENLITNVPLDRLGAMKFVAQRLAGYILSDDAVEPDTVEIKRTEVGDA